MLAKGIYWCKDCGVPLIGTKCNICGTEGTYSCNDMRLIFPQEHIFLEKKFKTKLPKPLFYSRGRYIYNGKTFGSLKMDGEPSFKLAKESNKIELKDDIEFDRYKELFVQANLPYIKEIEEEAVDYVRKIVEEHGDYGTYVAFSGGKDSTVVADIAKKALGNVKLFFGDTTIEFPDTYEYIERLKRDESFEFEIWKSDKNFFESMKDLDPPSQKMRWCCTVFKAVPLNNFLTSNDFANEDDLINEIRDKNRIKKILFFDGIRKAESSSRSKYERESGNKKASRQITARPILEWSSLAVWAYIFYSGIDYNRLYEKGYGRAGCMYCPYNTKYDDYLLKELYTEEWSNFQDGLKEYLLRTYTDKFEEYQYHIWLNNGWKYRLPHRKSNFKASVFCSPNSASSTYKFDCEVNDEIIEFMKPLGDVKIHELNTRKKFVVKKDGVFSLAGVVGADNIIFNVDNPKDKYKLKINLEKQIRKFMNCVHCGGCVGICPFGAISVKDNSYTIDESKCKGEKCQICIKTKFAGANCVSLSYKGELDKIEAIKV